MTDNPYRSAMPSSESLQAKTSPTLPPNTLGIVAAWICAWAAVSSIGCWIVLGINFHPPEFRPKTTIYLTVFYVFFSIEALFAVLAFNLGRHIRKTEVYAGGISSLLNGVVIGTCFRNALYLQSTFQLGSSSFAIGVLAIGFAASFFVYFAIVSLLKSKGPGNGKGGNGKGVRNRFGS